MKYIQIGFLGGCRFHFQCANSKRRNDLLFHLKHNTVFYSCGNETKSENKKSEKSRWRTRRCMNNKRSPEAAEAANLHEFSHAAHQRKTISQIAQRSGKKGMRPQTIAWRDIERAFAHMCVLCDRNAAIFLSYQKFCVRLCQLISVEIECLA